MWGPLLLADDGQTYGLPLVFHRACSLQTSPIYGYVEGFGFIPGELQFLVRFLRPLDSRPVFCTEISNLATWHYYIYMNVCGSRKRRHLEVEAEVCESKIWLCLFLAPGQNNFARLSHLMG
jgi:hypothetical protein